LRLHGKKRPTERKCNAAQIVRRPTLAVGTQLVSARAELGDDLLSHDSNLLA
jgi:hypothetical protein